MLRVLSYGGGVQSTALLVMAARRELGIDAVIHVDLGEAESPDTRAYVKNVAMPYAERHSIVWRNAYVDAVGDILANPAHPKPPFRSQAGSAPMARQCTAHWKIRPFRRLLRSMLRNRKIPLKPNAAIVFLGISYDEIERLSPSRVQYYSHEFPLVDRKLTRNDCVRIIASEGLPIPSKSACWFCPFSDALRAQSLLMRYPYLQRTARQLQACISDAREKNGLSPIRLLPQGEDKGNAGDCSGHCFV